MSLIVIGEASTLILSRYPDFASEHLDAPWKQMRGMRNRIAHGYFEVNFDTVWDTVKLSLPALIESLAAIPASAIEKENSKSDQ